jgi:hypothetical protein
MDYVISSDPSWVEVDVVWRFLSEESYWARGVPRETVLKSLANSIPFGVYEIGPQSRREQVGFARGFAALAAFHSRCPHSLRTIWFRANHVSRTDHGDTSTV